VTPSLNLRFRLFVVGAVSGGVVLFHKPFECFVVTDMRLLLAWWTPLVSKWLAALGYELV
jgi:hypothetical protein